MENRNKFNKKGNTLQVWIEIIIFVALFLGIIAIIGADMNTKYSQNYDLTLGLNLSSQMTSMDKYSTDMINQTTSGETEITDFGILKILSTPALLLTGVNIVWSVVSGGFIYNLIGNMNLGAYAVGVAIAFQIIYILAIGFILIKLVLRMNA